MSIVAGKTRKAGEVRVRSQKLVSSGKPKVSCQSCSSGVRGGFNKL
jgi:hypothetical protein